MPSVKEILVYSFAELSEKVKERVLDEHRDSYVAHDWWDAVYEDAVECARCLGIEIEKKSRSGRLRDYEDTAIYFSGFWSQGDGACFEGWYRYKPDAVDAIKAYAPKDEVLLDLAERLTKFQVQARLVDNYSLLASITTGNPSYSHSGTMTATVDDENGELGYTDRAVFYENELTPIFREFADWIYTRLEQEYEYLTSDEVVAESLVDETFDEDGSII